MSFLERAKVSAGLAATAAAKVCTVIDVATLEEVVDEEIAAGA